MLNINVQDGRVRQALEQLGNVGSNAAPAMKVVMEEHMATTMARAKALTPIARGYLRRSGQYRAWLVGHEPRGQVQFGGLAAAYAEVQHENEGLRHTLPQGVSRTMTTRKYRTEITGRRNDDVISISFRNDGKLKPRKRKHPIKGYRGGRSHFLHGRANSAWNNMRERLLQNDLIKAATDEFDRVLAKASGD